MDGTLLDLLENRAVIDANRPVYSFLDRNSKIISTLSFRDVYEQAIMFAAVLQSKQCAGRPVLLYCPHGPTFIVAFFACIAAGAWPVPITRARNGLDRLISACNAFAVVTTSRRAGILPEAMTSSGVQVLLVDEIRSRGEIYKRPTFSGSDTAFIQYTSGSTSSPKGIVISHDNVMHNAVQIQKAFTCNENDIGVSWLPFHHDMGLIGHVIEPLYAGLHNYFISPVDFLANPVRWLRAMSQFGGTLSGGPDFAFELAAARISEQELADLSLKKWRLAYCGAEKIRPESLRKFAQKFSTIAFEPTSFFPCYGLAESTLFVSGQHGISIQSPVQAENISASVCLGRPEPDTSIIIVNRNTGRKVAEGEIGEVCISSPSVASSYYGDSVASRKTFNRIREYGKYYCRTGDRGFIRNRKLFLLGRYKTVIKRRGRSIHAEDIEAEMKRELSAQIISRCVAFETNEPDSGGLVVILERAKKSTTKGESENTVSDQKLASRATAVVVAAIDVVPDDVCVLPANTLPLTSSGKIRRHLCPDIYLTRVKQVRRKR